MKPNWLANGKDKLGHALMWWPEDDWGDWDVAAYMACVPHENDTAGDGGDVLLSMDELRGLLRTVWILGKQD